MKDYYYAYIRKKNKNEQEGEVSKVSKAPFDTFDTNHSDTFENISSLDSLFETHPNLREQFEFEIEERIAIMIFDGKLSGADAKKAAQETTTQLWIGVFSS